MNKVSKEELATIMHLFYVKHELREAGIAWEGLSNSAILELYNTFFGSRFTPRREDEQRNRIIEFNANNESNPEDEERNPGRHGTVDQSTNPKDGGTGDQSTKPEDGGTGDQSTNPGISGTGDQSTNPGISLCSNGKDKDNSIDVINSVPSYLIPLDPASIAPRFKAPPHCNKEYNYATQEEKSDRLVNYHFMLKTEKEYYQSLSNSQVRCGSPTRSKVCKVDPNANLLKSFKAIMTDLSFFKQNNEYQTYIFSVNPNNFEPEPHSPEEPDNTEDSCSDDQVVDILPSPGNFGLNDLLNLAVIDDPPTTLSNWIDQQINPPPHSPPHRYEYQPSRDEAGPSRKRSLSPEDKNVKRHRVSDPSTVRVEGETSNVDMAVPGTSRGSNPPEDPYSRLPFAICTFCHYWFKKDPKHYHFCPSPLSSTDSFSD